MAEAPRRTPRVAPPGRALAPVRDGAAPAPDPHAALAFQALPRIGRNDAIWRGPTTSPGEVIRLAERSSGYRVAVIWRRTFGGWQSFTTERPGATLVDALERLVVDLVA